MKLSTHFYLSEFKRSDIAAEQGIDNKPDLTQIENLKYLCDMVLEPIRANFDSPIDISSGFRSLELNKAVGGTESSQHLALKGHAAADFTVRGFSVSEAFEYIRTSNLPFDQVINEFDKWIHISVYRPRGNALVAEKDSGKTKYSILST